LSGNLDPITADPETAMRIPNITRWFLLLVLLALGSCHMARSRGTRTSSTQLEHEADAQLIEELEIGMHALRELGEDEALARLQRIADGLRKEKAGAKKVKVGEVEAPGPHLDRRLEILGYARDAYREAGRQEQAKQVARFLKIGEMQKAGADPAELQKASEGMSMGTLIEHLRGASQLWEEWGWEGRAAACRGLAEYYAQRDGIRLERKEEPDVHTQQIQKRMLELRKELEALNEKLRGLDVR
jgi:hypothetical protein